MQDPVRYENNNSTAQEVVDVFLPKLISTMRWSPGEAVLDYGCGAGSPGFKCIFPKVEEFQSKMYSVDVSAKMIAFAKENYPHEHISYSVGDILGEFPFEEVKFDKIIAVNAFHFIRYVRKALAGFHRILKPNGQLMFIMFTANCIALQAYRKLAESSAWQEYMKDYENFYPIWSDFPEGQERSGMQNLMKTSGFHVSELEIHQRCCHFESMDIFLEVVLSGNPCLDNIPKELYVVFKDDFKEKVFYSG